MRQVAARLEKHTAALRSALDQTSRMDDGGASGASAKGSVAAAAARALDADAADAASSDDDADVAAHETRLRSYRTADVHIKKAAAKIAGHKKWYADRAKREKASESCAGALEALRLASMVLQRRHDEDAADAAAAARGKTRDAPATTTATTESRSASVASGEAGRRDAVDAVAVQSAVDALVATARRLRADADSVASREANARAELAAARASRDDAVAEAAAERVKRETAPVKLVVKRASPSPVKKEASSRRKATDGRTRATERETRDGDALRDLARATLGRKNAKSAKSGAPASDAPMPSDALTTPVRDEQKSVVASPSRATTGGPGSGGSGSRAPDAELTRALRAAKDERDALDSTLERARARLEEQRRAFEAALGARAEKVEALESRARLALEEGARWKALYVATRDDGARGIGAEEAEALRAALRASQDAHRRELSLLGAEHGNQCASLRRALADAERERSATRAASEASRRAAARAEAALASEREARREAEVLQRRSDGESRRVSKRCEALEADVASLRVVVEETERASRDLRDAETAARRRARTEAEKAKGDSLKDADWRVEALEARLASASELARREKARADEAERTLDNARRRAVEQQAQMAEAARRRKDSPPDAA